MADNWHPFVSFPLIATITADLFNHAQSVPFLALYSTTWPRLLNHLQRHTVANAVGTDIPCTVINAQTGYARTNRSRTVEHLLRSHVDITSPRRRGLRITILHTSQAPSIPSATADGVSRSAIGTLAAQISLAALAVRAGVASPVLLAAVTVDALAGLAVWAFLRRARRTDLAGPRTVGPGKREVVCLTAGNGSTDAVVIVSTGGAIKFDDLAEGRTPPPGRMSMLGIPLVVGLVGALVIGFARLPIVDAWCAAGLYMLGVVHASYASQTWRGPAALGFRMEEEGTRVVHNDKVMRTLMEIEGIERGAGLALLPVFFPGKLRPDEEAWWAEKRTWKEGSVDKV